MKRNENCFELAGGSSYRGFELPGIDCMTRSNDSHFHIIAIYLQTIRRSAIGQFSLSPATVQQEAWENSWHLATLPLVSPPNGVWETTAQIPYWWRVTTQIWVVLLIGWIKFPMARSIRSTTQIPSSVWNFCTSFSDVKPVVVSPLKCQPFSPAIQEVFVKVNLAQFNPSGFLSAKFPACPKKKGCLTL